MHVHTQITGWPFFCQKVWRLLSHLQRKVACLFDVGTYPYSLNAIHDGFREAMASASEPGQAHQTWLRPIPFKKHVPTLITLWSHSSTASVMMACWCQAAAGCFRSRCRCRSRSVRSSRAPSLALMSAASYSAAVIQRQRTAQVNARRGEPVRAMLHPPRIQGGEAQHMLSYLHLWLPPRKARPCTARTCWQPHILPPSPHGKASHPVLRTWIFW